MPFVLLVFFAYVFSVCSALAGPLHIAIRNGNVAEVRSLIAEGAKVNERDRLLGWPLHQAALHDSVEIAQVLVESGAELNPVHKIFGTPLHAAVQSGSSDAVRYLLAQGVLVNARHPDGRTALHMAAAAGSADLVEALIFSGADVNARRPRAEIFRAEYQASHEAASNGHWDIVALLAALGADPYDAVPISGFLADADVAAGSVAFHIHDGVPGCRSCHASDLEPKSIKNGPTLIGIVGRRKASVPDFGYSEALRRLGGIWTVAELNAFIAAPLDHVPGSSMDFVGIRDLERRVNIIAYLVSISR